MPSFDLAPVAWRDVEVLQAAFEMAYASRDGLLPPALTPTTPPLLIVLAWRVPGEFTMVQVRVSCRSGVRPRGFVVAAVCDAPSAVDQLAAWGLPVRLGNVTLKRNYDAVELRGDGLHLVAADPDPLSPGDVQYTVTMTLADTPRGSRLVQLEPEYDLERVERVRPRLLSFDAGAWGEPRLTPRHPVSATIAVGAVTLPKPRFVCRPDISAFEGTETL